MLKRIGLLSAIVSSLAIGALPAVAQSGSIAQFVYYYSDASMTTRVGLMTPRCLNGDVIHRLSGIQTAYWDTEDAYICGPNGPEPL